VERPTEFGAERPPVQRAVQTEDSEDPEFRRIVRRKPARPQRLRKFKRLDGQIGRFVVRAVNDVELDLDRGKPVAQLRVLGGERVLVDRAGDREIDQPILLRDEERLLPPQFVALAARVVLGVSGVGGQHQGRQRRSRGRVHAPQRRAVPDVPRRSHSVRARPGVPARRGPGRPRYLPRDGVLQDRARRAERRDPTCTTPGRTRSDLRDHGAIRIDPKDARRSAATCRQMRNRFVNTTAPS